MLVLVLLGAPVVGALRRRGTAAALAAALVCAGCGGSGISRYGQAAEQVRELSLLHDVPMVTLSRQQFEAQASQDAATISDKFLAQYADTYGRFGFFDPSIDLRPVFAGSSSEWVGATYSPSKKNITLVGNPPPDTIVHEWVHALQDQHFNLQNYDDNSTSDAFLARRAVVEGDAVLAQYRYLAETKGEELDGIDWARIFAGWKQYSDDTLANASYPVIFLDYVSFVYAYGLQYTAGNLLGVSVDKPLPTSSAPYDWSLEDQLFTDRPPPSTEAVLKREYHGSDPADPVSDFGLEDVPASLAGKLTMVDWDRLGQWYTYLLLYPLEARGEMDARSLAAAWDGDKLLFVTDIATGAPGALWASAWDDADAAAAIEEAMRRLYGVRGSADGSPNVGVARDGDTVYIERRGAQLIVAKDIEPALAASLADAAFSGIPSSARRRRPSLAAALEQLLHRNLPAPERRGRRRQYGVDLR